MSRTQAKNTAKNAELRNRISQLNDQIMMIESNLNNFKLSVSADIKKLLDMINKPKR